MYEVITRTIDKKWGRTQKSETVEQSPPNHLICGLFFCVWTIPCCQELLVSARSPWDHNGIHKSHAQNMRNVGSFVCGPSPERHKPRNYCQNVLVWAESPSDHSGIHWKYIVRSETDRQPRTFGAPRSHQAGLAACSPQVIFSAIIFHSLICYGQVTIKN